MWTNQPLHPSPRSGALKWRPSSRGLGERRSFVAQHSRTKTLALTIGFQVSFLAPTRHSHGGIDANSYTRSNEVDGLPLLDVDSNAQTMAAMLLAGYMMPKQAAADALHVAVAAFGGVKYLLTLNCRHIANAHELSRVYQLLQTQGCGGLLICTPAEFLGST